MSEFTKIAEAQSEVRAITRRNAVKGPRPEYSEKCSHHRLADGSMYTYDFLIFEDTAIVREMWGWDIKWEHEVALSIARFCYRQLTVNGFTAF